jgi:hypothetical protein
LVDIQFDNGLKVYDQVALATSGPFTSFDGNVYQAEDFSGVAKGLAWLPGGMICAYRLAGDQVHQPNAAEQELAV